MRHQIIESNTVKKARGSDRSSSGIPDYAVLWQGLKGNPRLNAGVRQVSHGLSPSIKEGLRTHVLGQYNSGIPDAYQATRGTYAPGWAVCYRRRFSMKHRYFFERCRR
jgi:hypothetical protein